jgi:hypothetical protein
MRLSLVSLNIARNGAAHFRCHSSEDRNFVTIVRRECRQCSSAQIAELHCGDVAYMLGRNDTGGTFVDKVTKYSIADRRD